MKATLCTGLAHEFSYQVPVGKTVPHVYPESELFRSMPEVFATAYMVGLIEWACLEALRPHLEPGEQSVGTDIRVSHNAATPPGFIVKVGVVVEKVEGRRISFRVDVHDGVESISSGTHERFVIDRQRFLEKVERKAALQR